MAHSNLNKLPAGSANEGMQVEAAEDQNPPPVLPAAEGTPTRVPIPAIPGAPQPPMGQMPAPPPDLCWLDIINALVTMPPLYPGVTLHPYTRTNLPGWRAVVRYKNLRSHVAAHHQILWELWLWTHTHVLWKLNLWASSGAPWCFNIWMDWFVLQCVIQHFYRRIQHASGCTNAS
jgi:hypothetical protein